MTVWGSFYETVSFSYISPLQIEFRWKFKMCSDATVVSHFYM